MSIAVISLDRFNLCVVMGLQVDSTFWVYINKEWQLHQIDTIWTVVPDQWLLYRAMEVEEEDCLGLEEELEKQLRGAVWTTGGKRKGEDLVSPLKKNPKVSENASPLPSSALSGLSNASTLSWHSKKSNTSRRQHRSHSASLLPASTIVLPVDPPHRPSLPASSATQSESLNITLSVRLL
jgi:hypothetical protein